MEMKYRNKVDKTYKTDRSMILNHPLVLLRSLNETRIHGARLQVPMSPVRKLRALNRPGNAWRAQRFMVDLTGVYHRKMEVYPKW
jgi:hypothetical protein